MSLTMDTEFEFKLVNRASGWFFDDDDLGAYLDDKNRTTVTIEELLCFDISESIKIRVCKYLFMKNDQFTYYTQIVPFFDAHTSGGWVISSEDEIHDYLVAVLCGIRFYPYCEESEIDEKSNV